MSVCKVLITLSCLLFLSFPQDCISSQSLSGSDLLSMLPIKKKKIALFPFKNATDMPNLQESIPDLLHAEFFRTNLFEPVERKRLYKAIWDIAFTNVIKIDNFAVGSKVGPASQTVDVFSLLDRRLIEEAALRVNADYMVSGTVNQFDKLIRIDLDFIKTSGKKVVGSLSAETQSMDKIPDTIRELTAAITSIYLQTNIEEIADDLLAEYRGGLSTFETTVSNLKEIARLVSGSIYPNALLLTLYAEQGLEKEVIETCEAIISAVSDSQPGLLDVMARLGIDPYYILAEIYEKSGMLQKASEVYEAAIKAIPINRPVYYKRLGIVFLKQGEIKSAINAFQESIKLYPEDFDVHYQLARAYEDGDQGSNALKEYKECLRYSAGRVKGIPIDEIKQKIKELE